MRAGDLDRQITIRRFTSGGDDGYGNQIEIWTDLATVWAEVKQSNGREFLDAGRISDEHRVVFKVRWMDGVLTTDRILYAGIEHDIVEVRELGRREGIELHSLKRA